jgi:3-hydroxyacyl-CoA dehydrogenase
MRFADPMNRGRLEIIRGLETDDEALAIVAEVGKRMGREVIVVKDDAGILP